jgi:O-antigen/teichoic acid export membrane protein
VTRARKAALTSGFGYLQFASAIVLGLVVTPMVLRQVDARSYGLWLAVGELLGYIALADVGVFAVLPWTIAEAEGRRNRNEIRAFIANGFAMGIALAAVTVISMSAVWFLAPAAIGLTPADRAVVQGPLALLVVATVVSAPLAVFNAALIGLQDVTFVGSTAVVRSTTTAVLTVILLASGWGLYALSIGAAIPMVTLAFLNTIRLGRIEPQLLRGWPRPTSAQIRRLVTEGIGGWLGGFGWRLSAMSNGLVLAASGRADWIAVYACTSKVVQLLLQLCWIVPDSALVGLAQIHGEGRAERRREITAALFRLYLVLAGGAAILVLAANASFVRLWVGPEFFAGVAVNVVLAAGLISGSIGHAFAALGSALGRRLPIGFAGLVQGAVHVLLAVTLTLLLGLEGLALAAILSVVLTMIPIGLRTLHAAAGFEAGQLARDVNAWSWRAAPALVCAALVGATGATLWVTGVAAVALCIAYVWSTRSLYAHLPIDSRYRRLLATVRLA